MNAHAIKKIALFGGSFDPPHWGHRQVVDYLRGLDLFDEVWVLPAFDHPFAKGLADFADRLEMLRLTLAGFPPQVRLCDREGELQRHPTYTIDVVLDLKKNYPKHLFTLVVGSDCKSELREWRRIDELKELAQFYFIPRAGFEASPFMNISSSQLRQLIREGKSVTKFVVPEVAQYIESKKPYANTQDS